MCSPYRGSGHEGLYAGSDQLPIRAVTRSRPTANKRNVQQQKREKAKAKQERRAARRLEDPASEEIRVEATEAELIEELAALHRAVEMATLSPDELETRREQIRLQLEQIHRRGP